MIEVQSFVFNPLQENTYVLFDETKECVVVDPGCIEREERYELESFLEDKQLTVKMLINTHCHVDHVLGNYFVKERYKTKLFVHKNELPVLKAVTVYAPNYGFFQYQETEPDGFFDEGDSITFGNQTLKILFVP